MVRLAVLICVVAGLVWAVGIYKLGDKPLSGHLKEIYQSDLVQKKVTALQQGVDERIAEHVEKAKTAPKQRRVAARQDAKPAPVIDEPEPTPAPQPAPAKVIDVRPQTKKSEPAHDALTDSDRKRLDALLNEKLKR